MDIAHGEHVAKLCSQIFSHTTHLHGLTKTWGPIVKVAGFLQGSWSPYAGTESVAAEFETQLKRHIRTFTPAQYRIVVKALRLQKNPSMRQARITGHMEDELAVRIAAIVRIADALDEQRTQDTCVAGIEEQGKSVCLLVFPGAGSIANASAALGRMDLWNSVTPRPFKAVRVLGASEDPPGFIQPEHSTGQVACRLQQRQFDQFVTRIFGLRFHEDVEYVHEMRVALRRLRALVKLFGKSLGERAIASDDELRRWATELGTTRDLDVFLLYLHRYTERSDSKHRLFLKELFARERASRNRHARRVIARLQSKQFNNFLRRYRLSGTARVGRVISQGRAARPIRAEGPRLLIKRLNTAMQYDKPLRSYTSGELHRLRIRCKRVRYAAEFLRELYPDGLASFIETMLDMQDLLGNVHDIGLYIERVKKYCDAHALQNASDEANAAEALLDAMADEQSKCLRKASRAWARFRKKENFNKVIQHIRTPAVGLQEDEGYN